MWSKIVDGLKKIKFFRSLRVRLCLIIFIVSMVPGLTMYYGLLSSYTKNEVTVQSNNVLSQAKILANHLITYNYLLDTTSEMVNAELAQVSNMYDGRILIIDNNFKIIKDTYGISEGKYSVSEEIIRSFKGESVTNYDKTNRYIEITVPIISKTSTEQNADMLTNTTTEAVEVAVGAVLISVSTDNIIASQNVLARRGRIIEVLICTFSFALAALFSRLLLKPFNKITDAINEVKNGFSDEEISVKEYLETEHIGDAFNMMMKRTKVLDDSREEFVSNVSHELKTPLTSMKVLADSLLMQEEVPNELYREFMQDIGEEIERENKIINDLLALVKMTRTAADVNISSMDINALLELIMKRLSPIAQRANIELVYESMRKVVADVDEVKLTLALTNLIENAIKYNNEHGWVKVVLDADHQYFTVTVSDSGIGIPQESLEHIYERFYRVDKSHSREIGGTGLGLAITRNAILMHKGTIQVESEEGKGTTFTVRIPLTYIM